MTMSEKRGFTLVELLVVVVLGGMMVLSIYQVLATNSRTYTVNNAQIQGQQALRAGMDILFSEIREISTEEGDLVGMGADFISVRAQRAFGVACDVDYTVAPNRITSHRLGPAFQAGDSVVIFADNDPALNKDDAWLTKTIQTVDTTSATCPDGSWGQTFGISNLASTGDSVRLGAPVRAFDTYTYGLFDYGGETYLGRWASASMALGRPDPLVGPLVPARGVSFRYLDSIGAVTTVDTLVAQIEVTLRYQSEVRDARNQQVADSIVGLVYPRN
jgi:prepilin-type N-terminal cleavage/methylation domain-containing protein